MSLQSDVEMLSVRAMEEYANRKHMTGTDVMDLFHRHQVIEKIMIQHEYLHQISFEEVMEFIEKTVEEATNKLILFHGTISVINEIDLKKSKNRRDFGKGFYTTVLERQAKEWAYRLSLREKADKYNVYQYSFTEDSSLKIKRFDSLSEEWLEFIKENRANGGIQHDYDVVIGPVADDNTMETVQLYIAGILKASEAVERLRYSQVNNQVSFHTEKALSFLEFIRSSEYNE